MGDEKKKTLCNWKKDKLKDNFEAFRTLVIDAKYACRNCGRVAKEERYLCKPVDLMKNG